MRRKGNCDAYLFGDAQSDEEIDKQRIDEKLDALSRAKLILNQGNDVQKHNIALTLPSLVRVFQAEAVEQVLAPMLVRVS